MMFSSDLALISQATTANATILKEYRLVTITVIASEVVAAMSTANHTAATATAEAARDEANTTSIVGIAGSAVAAAVGGRSCVVSISCIVVVAAVGRWRAGAAGKTSITVLKMSMISWYLAAAKKSTTVFNAFTKSNVAVCHYFVGTAVAYHGANVVYPGRVNAISTIVFPVKEVTTLLILRTRRSFQIDIVGKDVHLITSWIARSGYALGIGLIFSLLGCDHVGSCLIDVRYLLLAGENQTDYTGVSLKGRRRSVAKVFQRFHGCYGNRCDLVLRFLEVRYRLVSMPFGLLVRLGTLFGRLGRFQILQLLALALKLPPLAECCGGHKLEVHTSSS